MLSKSFRSDIIAWTCIDVAFLLYQKYSGQHDVWPDRIGLVELVAAVVGIVGAIYRAADAVIAAIRPKPPKADDLFFGRERRAAAKAETRARRAAAVKRRRQMVADWFRGRRAKGAVVMRIGIGAAILILGVLYLATSKAGLKVLGDLNASISTPPMGKFKQSSRLGRVPHAAAARNHEAK